MAVSKLWSGKSHKELQGARVHEEPKTGKVKLTLEQVKDLLALKGTMSQRKAAKLFGISQVAVSYIWSGKNHQYVQR